MPKNYAPFEVACPCCGALLKIDADTKAVIAHTPKAVPKTFEDLEAAARAMKDQDSRKESHLSAIGGGAKALGRSAGEKISGSPQAGQGNSRHRQAAAGLRSGLKNQQPATIGSAEISRQKSMAGNASAQFPAILQMPLSAAAPENVKTSSELSRAGTPWDAAECVMASRCRDPQAFRAGCHRRGKSPPSSRRK